MSGCNSDNSHPVRSLNGTSPKEFEDLKYLGSHIPCSEKHFTIRNGMAWSACNDMHKIWLSQLPNYLNAKIFRATIEPILGYGSETKTLSKNTGEETRRELHSPSEKSTESTWKRHPSISQIYGELPRVSSLVKYRRASFSSHCIRADAEPISSLLLCRPSFSQAIGRKLSCPDVRIGEGSKA